MINEAEADHADKQRRKENNNQHPTIIPMTATLLSFSTDLGSIKSISGVRWS
jgi:hypothetical protein